MMYRHKASRLHKAKIFDIPRHPVEMLHWGTGLVLRTIY